MISDNFKTARLGEFVLACLYFMANNSCHSHLFSVSQGITSTFEIFRSQVQLDLGLLAGDFGSKDQATNQFRSKSPTDPFGSSGHALVSLEFSEGP